LVKWAPLEVGDVLVWCQYLGYVLPSLLPLFTDLCDGKGFRTWVADAQYSMVRTEMGEKGFAAVKEWEVDFTPYMISVEESGGGIMKVIEEAMVDGTHVRLLGPGELP